MLAGFVGLRQNGQDMKNLFCVYFPPSVGSICEPSVLDPGPALVRYLLSNPEHVMEAYPYHPDAEMRADQGRTAD